MPRPSSEDDDRSTSGLDDGPDLPQRSGPRVRHRGRRELLANRYRLARLQVMAPRPTSTKRRSTPRKGPDGLDKVLFVRANQDLLDKLDLLRDRQSLERPGIVLSRADVARAILWDAVNREGLGG